MIPPANKVIEFAKTHGLKIVQGGTGPIKCCARKVLAIMNNEEMYYGNLEGKLQISKNDLEMYEAGFEGFPYYDNGFFQMGHEVLELSRKVPELCE